jgi:hypothetical protein
VEQRNYEYFLRLYAKYIDPVADTFAYCLLKNHFHALVRIKAVAEILATLDAAQKRRVAIISPGAPGETSSTGLPTRYPSKQFSDFFNAYAKAINKAYDRTGSLFQHPFGRVVVAGGTQFFNVMRYIHQNPQKHRFVENFGDWKWSSYSAPSSIKPARLSPGMILDWFGSREQYWQYHSEMVGDAVAQPFAEDDPD